MVGVFGPEPASSPKAEGVEQVVVSVRVSQPGERRVMKTGRPRRLHQFSDADCGEDVVGCHGEPASNSGCKSRRRAWNGSAELNAELVTHRDGLQLNILVVQP